MKVDNPSKHQRQPLATIRGIDHIVRRWDGLPVIGNEPFELLPIEAIYGLRCAQPQEAIPRLMQHSDLAGCAAGKRPGFMLPLSKSSLWRRSGRLSPDRACRPEGQESHQAKPAGPSMQMEFPRPGAHNYPLPASQIEIVVGL
jgi:hypothetical protein